MFFDDVVGDGLDVAVLIVDVHVEEFEWAGVGFGFGLERDVEWRDESEVGDDGDKDGCAP